MHHRVDDEIHEASAQAADTLRTASRVAVLTGAGVSAESGVPTFRGAGGLWEGHRLEEVATPFAFERDPALVWRFYNARRNNLRSIQPNAGHHALAQLERRLGADSFTLITQNVDGLHQAAGSRNVLELHGNLARVRCTRCGKIEDRGGEVLPDLPRCACGGLLRPDIVWFHEMLPQDVWQRAEAAVQESECLLVVGTSAVVYPAAGLIDLAQCSGAFIIEVNVERTEVSRRVNLALCGPSGVVLPQIMERLMAAEEDHR